MRTPLGRQGPDPGPLRAFDSADEMRAALDRRDRAERRRAAAPVQDLGAAELAHDVLRELAVVRHLLDRLDRTPDDEGRQALLGTVRTQCEVAEQALRSAARPAAPGAVDLVTTVRAVVASAAQVFGGRLELEVQEQVAVRGDGALLHRALANLVANACEAAGTVSVTLGTRGGQAVVQVDDDGAAGDREEPDRPGRGLWVVRAVVQDAGGTVVRGTGRLGGRSVRVSLPLLGSAP